jgi:hypothetical protein
MGRGFGERGAWAWPWVGGEVQEPSETAANSVALARRNRRSRSRCILYRNVSIGWTTSHGGQGSTSAWSISMSV